MGRCASLEAPKQITASAAASALRQEREPEILGLLAASTDGILEEALAQILSFSIASLGFRQRQIQFQMFGSNLFLLIVNGIADVFSIFSRRTTIRPDGSIALKILWYLAVFHTRVLR